MSSSIPGQSFQQTYETNIQQIKSLDLFDFEGKTLEQVASDFVASSAATIPALQRTTSRDQRPNLSTMEQEHTSDGQGVTDLWRDFETMYQERSQFLTSSPSLRALSQRSLNIEEALNSLVPAAQATIDCLDSLSKIHPFIGIAVQPFTLVIKLEIARRENDKKIVAVNVRMKDFMTCFFELRRFRHSESQTTENISIAERLEPAMHEIAKDIKECGSACDAYMKKSFLARATKAKNYESRFAEFIERFESHRQKLMETFVTHAAQGVDLINEKVNDLGLQLQRVEDGIETISGMAHALLNSLSSQRETDVLKFASKNGGFEKCLKDDELFKELVSRSGETWLQLSVQEGVTTQRAVIAKEELLRELKEDVDTIFERNMLVFDRKLKMQEMQLENIIKSESRNIIQTFSSGAHDRITDPGLRKIWKDMGWKGSVKARHFVLALHDYYSEEARGTLYRKQSLNAQPTAPISFPTPSVRNDDWALAYINATYVQSILEAIDDDGTGFISVKEVNTFIASRPDGWSLPEWLAYWALGWHISVTAYRDKIRSTAQAMYSTARTVLPPNRQWVAEYFMYSSFDQVELMLRSTLPINNYQGLQDPDLSRITKEYTEAEEKRIESNLKAVAHELDTPTTVHLVTGEGRIERYALPLLHLLLLHHHKILQIACKHVIKPDELFTLARSLGSVFDAIHYRIQNLKALFKQTHLDVDNRFENFAFGMLLLLTKPTKSSPRNNILSEELYESMQRSTNATDTAHEQEGELPLDIVKFGVQDTLEFPYSEKGQASESFSEISQQFHPILGVWTCRISYLDSDDDLAQYTSQITIEEDAVDGNITAMASTGPGMTANFRGTARATETGFDLNVVEDTEERSFRATVDVETGIMAVSWSDGWEEQYTRTPPSLVRYRYTPQQFLEDPTRSRRAFAWNAVLHVVRQKLWDKKFIQARLLERKRFVELSLRLQIDLAGYTPRKPLDRAEKMELSQLQVCLTPAQAKFFLAITQFELDKVTKHRNSCDNCYGSIIGPRLFCLECANQDLSDYVDLCLTCADKLPPPSRGFTHLVSHSMVKVKYVLHDVFYADVVDRAKRMADRIKRLFSPPETGANVVSIDKRPEQPMTAKLCDSCSQPIVLPCWVCLDCQDDLFICLQCDSEGKPTTRKDSDHKIEHHLLRVAAPSTTEEASTVNERLDSLQQRIVNMEQKLSATLSGHDESINRRLSTLEEKLSVYEAETALRISGLESLLRQFLPRLELALPKLAPLSEGEGPAGGSEV
ncbi:hypothetical protein D9613_000104 [Agrocybe pediades]|uniref:EF-hand domain-containing protein n=1 Tax=Agrocybe pediades TaxID=84607 RepID=A0A8H4R0D5_9AGAR|nr:hypothetical protein D9613_000104 [Agrocybe pediades]